jgi:hypothetical protein
VTRAAAALLAACAAVLGVAVAQAAPPKAAATRAGNFLVAHQNADGGWTTSPAVDEVADGVVALVSAGVTGTPLTKALSYVTTHGPADANRAAMTARVILAAVAAGKDPSNFGDVDYVRRVHTYYNPNTGAYDTATDSNSLVLLALMAAKDALPEKAVTSLQGRQCDDGGLPRSTCLFGGSNVLSTALALNALAAAGVGPSDPVFAKAHTYLVAAQNADGGFGDEASQPTTALPTAAALAAVIAIGEDPTATPWLKSAGHSPETALVSLQATDGGMRASGAVPTGDEVTTARALPGLAGLALPVRPAPPPSATTSTAVRPTTPGATVTTAAQASSTTRVGRRPISTVPPPGSTPTTVSKSDVKLAAPADNNAGGRSLLGMLPFAATLFGAGAVGLLLRRRARI